MKTTFEPPGYLAEPTIQYLFQVLEQIRTGEIQFPRFQRFDVWKPEQRRELLRSIKDGIPIGTLLIWRTRRDDVRVERRVGVHDLPDTRPGETTRQYILDGVQRLTTLYSALFLPRRNAVDDDGETADDFRVFYDLNEQDFFSATDLDDGEPGPQHLPLTALYNSVDLLRFQRGLRGMDAEKLTERADSLARSFREYKVPVVPLASDDLAHATKTFQRINTQGTSMSEVHMVNALVYGKSFDLLERIHEGKQEKLSSCGWASLEDEAVLRAIKALLRIDVYATKPDETRNALKKRPEVVDEAIEALVSAAEFFKNTMGIHSPELVPYGAQIILVARILHGTASLKKRARTTLQDWISLTTFTELFASNMSASRFDLLAQELRAAVRGDSLIWSIRRPLSRRPLPARFDFRHARARFLALRMAREGATDSRRDIAIDPFQLLAAQGASAVPQLVTTRMLTRGAGSWMQSPGARVVAAEGSLQTLRSRLSDPKAPSEFLRSHLVSPEVHRLFVKSRFKEAVETRARDLNAMEEAEFGALVSRHRELGKLSAQMSGDDAGRRPSKPKTRRRRSA